MSEQISILLVLTTIVVACASLLLGYLLSERSKQRDKIRQNRAHLTSMREYYEERLEKANKAAIENYDLWQDANRLIVEAQVQQDAEARTYYENNFLARIGITSPPKEKYGSALVLMPISSSHSSVYIAVRAACNRCSFVPIRSDEEFVVGNLLKKIVELILEAEVIICDVSSRNANVFYELGIAHAFNKSVILISEQHQAASLPFDIIQNKVVFYKHHGILENELYKSLKEFRSQKSKLALVLKA